MDITSETGVNLICWLSASLLSQNRTHRKIPYIKIATTVNQSINQPLFAK